MSANKRRGAESAERRRRYTDEQIIEWARRHDLVMFTSLTDLRCMFEDAATNEPEGNFEA